MNPLPTTTTIYTFKTNDSWRSRVKLLLKELWIELWTKKKNGKAQRERKKNWRWRETKRTIFVIMSRKYTVNKMPLYIDIKAINGIRLWCLLAARTAPAHRTAQKKKSEWCWAEEGCKCTQPTGTLYNTIVTTISMDMSNW